MTPEAGWGLEASGGRKEQLSGVKLHNPSREAQEATPCPLQTLQRAKPLPHTRAKELQEAPGYPPGAGDPVLSSPTSCGPVCPHRVALPVWRTQLPPGRSQGAVAGWLEESDLCPFPPHTPGTAFTI